MGCRRPGGCWVVGHKAGFGHPTRLTRVEQANMAASSASDTPTVTRISRRDRTPPRSGGQIGSD